MPGTVIVGTQWGDEGKGRFTDYLAKESDARRALPGRPQRRPHDRRRRRGVRAPARAERRALPARSRRSSATASSSTPRSCSPSSTCSSARASTRAGSRLSGNAHLIMPYHQELDRVTERYLGKNKLGHHQARHRPRVRRQGAARRPAGPGPARPEDLPREARPRAPREERRARQGLQPAAARRRRDRDAVPRDGAAPRADDRRHRPPRPRGARRRPAGAVRGRAGHVPRPRPRHVSVRHVVEPDRRRRVHRRGRRAAGDRPRRSASRRRTSTRVGAGPFPTELLDGDAVGEVLVERGPRVRHEHRSSPSPRLARRGDAAPRGAAQHAAPSSRSRSSTCSRRSPS